MSPHRRSRALALIVAFLVFVAAGCGDDEPAAVISSGNNPVTAPRDLVDTAISEGFSTLVAAVDQAQMVDQLRADGPLTVFAPTDDAFAALPDGLIPLLLENANRGLLLDILEHHVVEGLRLSPELLEDGRVTSLEGSPITVELVEEPAETDDADPVTRVEIGGEATLSRPDLLATNGVIHVIDTVLVPDDRADDLAELIDSIPEITDIVTTAEEAGTFSTLLELLEAAGLSGTLAGEGPFTVFAPTDAAFNRLGAAQRQLLADDPDLLESVLLFHVLPRRVNSFDVSTQRYLTTLEGQGARFVNVDRGSSFTFAGVAIATADIEATNGVIHVVDTVLIPDSVRGPGGL
jgi:transforming growth factor-beta-induced protein